MTGQALVVGGSSTIGTAIARVLADEGYAVSLWGRDPGRLRAAADTLRAAGADATARAVDVRDDGAMRDALALESDLRVAVWAAGRFDWADADQADPAIWRDLLDVNLTSAAVFTALVAPTLVTAPSSALVYIGSGAGRRVFPHNAAYVASKHGLAGLAGATFLDLRDRGVKVSIVSPGLVAAGGGLTSPQGRVRPETLLQPDDVAAAVRFVVTFPATGCPVEIDLQPQRAR